MIEPPSHNSFGFTLFAALSGAITALAFSSWKELDWKRACATLFVGFTFALIAAPWIAFSLFRIDEADGRAVAMITYVSAAGAHIFIPLLIKKMSKAFEGEKL